MSPEVKEKLRIVYAELLERWNAGETLSNEDKGRLVALTKLPRQGADFTSRDFYISYKKSTKGNAEYRVSESLYGAITRGYMRKQMDNLVFNKKEVKLCPNIGTFSIISFMPSPHKHKKRINYPETKKRGFVVYYMNEHSGGKIYKVKWECNHHIPFYTYYKFDTFKPLRLKLHENIMNNNAEYL